MDKVVIKGGGGDDGGGGGGGDGGGASSVTSTDPMEEQAKARVETIRRMLKKLMKTQQKLLKWMVHCDKTLKGVLGRAAFAQVVRKVVQKVGQKEVKESLMENIWASVKKGSATGVGWEVVEHEVMKQWVFPEE